MNSVEQVRVDSADISDFARVIQPGSFIGRQSESYRGFQAKLDLDPDEVKNGLGQLVLTLIKLLHELLERQAIRRIDAGSLTDEEVERLGLTLMKQAQEIERLKEVFGLRGENLNLDLGPLGTLL